MSRADRDSPSHSPQQSQQPTRVQGKIHHHAHTNRHPHPTVHTNQTASKALTWPYLATRSSKLRSNLVASLLNESNSREACSGERP
eukprot:scaffold730_cov206-Alexandrium_tamarense.AAC.18